MYGAALGADFMRPRGGEHGMACETDDQPANQLAIVDHTRPIGPLTPVRDSAWPAALPAEAAPLFAPLRALDTLPRRPLVADSFPVGVPVRLLPDSLAGPVLISFSRVAYSADGRRALVYGVKKCRHFTAADEEEGSIGFAFLLPLVRRADAWASSSEPLYLTID